MKFNGTEITKETIQQTRKWFSNNALACIEEAKSGKLFVNDLEKYIELKTKSSIEYLEGNHDHVFAFVQRAYYIQTGESVPLLGF